MSRRTGRLSPTPRRTAAQVAAEQVDTVDVVPLPHPLTEQVHPPFPAEEVGTSVQNEVLANEELPKSTIRKVVPPNAVKAAPNPPAEEATQYDCHALTDPHRSAAPPRKQCLVPHDQCQDDYSAAPIIHNKPHLLPQSPAPSWPGYYLPQDHHPSLHLTGGAGVACSDGGGGASQPWQGQYQQPFLWFSSAASASFAPAPRLSSSSTTW